LFYTFQNVFNIFDNKNLIPLFISNISNLFSINPNWAYSIAFIFFSMAGIPPLCGFFSKVFVLSSLIQINENFISVLFLTVSAISTFYYLRILKIVFFENKSIKTTNKSLVIFNSYLFNIEIFLIVFYLFLLLLFFFYPTDILMFSQYILLNFYNI
jgi:NADH-quinone oxidoreductase subunit N